MFGTGQPEEVSPAAIYLLSDASAYTTGSVSIIHRHRARHWPHAAVSLGYISLMWDAQTRISYSSSRRSRRSWAVQHCNADRHLAGHSC